MASKPILVEARFRSQLERQVANQLAWAEVPYVYEGEKVYFTIPAFNAKYLPDFRVGGTNIIIEAKGAFGNGRRAEGTEARQRLILVQEQNPHLDIRLVFEKADTKIHKGSKTTQGKWATDHGFKWSDKGIVPPEWIEEMKQKQTK